MGSWAKILDSQRDDYCRRYYADRVGVDTLAAELGAKSPTLERSLRAWRAQHGERLGLQKRTEEVPSKVEKPADDIPTPAPGVRSTPQFDELFQTLKKKSWTLDELADRYDRSKTTVRAWLNGMKACGYMIKEDEEAVSFDASTKRPKVERLPETLADKQGQVVVFAVASDSHVGSKYAQPTARKAFLDIAYYEYGVHHVFDPGDTTTGVNGYRGQQYDLVPSLQGYSSKQAATVTQHQIWMADQYTPRYPGLTYYQLGGNHDYWHVTNSGIDAVAALCNRRDDMVYLGYDLADIPLTDRVDIRLWHPGGGGSNSLSAGLQKAMDRTAYEELESAIADGSNPRLRILLAGHMHSEVKFQRGQMLAAHVGCFEGQTDYLKRKGLYPAIGGAIFKVWLTDGGLIQRTEYTFIPFLEIEDDWVNWPMPETEGSVLQEPANVKVLFSAKE